MKYSISINQKAVVEAGLDKKTDLVDWAILGYIKDWVLSPYAHKKLVDDKLFVWIHYPTLIKSLPLAHLNKVALLKKLKNLKELGLVETLKDSGMVYFHLTELYLSVCGDLRLSEDDSKLGKEMIPSVDKNETVGIKSLPIGKNLYRVGIKSLPQYNINNNSSTNHSIKEKEEEKSEDFSSQNFKKQVISRDNKISSIKQEVNRDILKNLKDRDKLSVSKLQKFYLSVLSENGYIQTMSPTVKEITCMKSMINRWNAKVSIQEYIDWVVRNWKSLRKQFRNFGDSPTFMDIYNLRDKLVAIMLAEKPSEIVFTDPSQVPQGFPNRDMVIKLIKTAGKAVLKQC